MKKGQVSIGDLRVFVGLVILVVGVLGSSFVGIGFVFSNTNLIWVGGLLVGTISIIAAILEKVFMK